MDTDNAILTSLGMKPRFETEDDEVEAELEQDRQAFRQELIALLFKHKDVPLYESTEILSALSAALTDVKKVKTDAGKDRCFVWEAFETEDAMHLAILQARVRSAQRHIDELSAEIDAGK
jgi:hypothetical protein